jgi:hypothetical protein
LVQRNDFKVQSEWPGCMEQVLADSQGMYVCMYVCM